MLIGSKRTFLYALSLIVLASIITLFAMPEVLYVDAMVDDSKRMVPHRLNDDMYPRSASSYDTIRMDRVNRFSYDRSNRVSFTRNGHYAEWNVRNTYDHDLYFREANNFFPYGANDLYREKSVEKKDVKNETTSEQVVSTYTIQKGDTLYRIAKLFDTTVDLLMVENNISDPTKMQIGQKIHVPVADDDQEITEWLDDNERITNVFHATLTAYTAGVESTGKTPSHPQYGITASGAKVKENHTIAVDPKVIPFGTLVYIEGLGIRKAEDTGSAIRGNKIDVYIPDLDEAIQFGVKKNVKVYVLDTKNKNEVRIASSKP